MSLCLGMGGEISFLQEQSVELFIKIVGGVGSGLSGWHELQGERESVGTGQAFNGFVVEVLMGDDNVFAEGAFQGESVVLGGDIQRIHGFEIRGSRTLDFRNSDPAGEFADREICSSVAGFQGADTAAQGQTQELMAEADTHEGQGPGQDPGDGLAYFRQVLRVAGAVR